MGKNTLLGTGNMYGFGDLLHIDSQNIIGTSTDADYLYLEGPARFIRLIHQSALFQQINY